jgi:hypothetical protein
MAGDAHSLDRAVLRAARHTTAADPIGLMDILWGVDAQERMVLSHVELAGALERLIHAGKLAEAGRLRFYAPRTPPPERRFSGVSLEEHAHAVAEYRREFARVAAESEAQGDEDTGRPLVVIRWLPLNGESISDDDEDRVDDLVDQIEPLLPDTAGAEVLGFERGSGELDVLIWGESAASDADVDAIYRAMQPAFRAFGCPKGSHVIRHYDGGEREEESDWV